MARKRSRSANTGDKAIYANRNARTEAAKNDDDDTMYDRVDRYHNQKDADFLKLDANNEGTSSSDEDEAVLDLGLDKDVDSSDEDTEEESEDDDDEEDPAMLSSSEDEEELEPLEDVRKWGTRKSSYYHGDTADLEIGQDQEDAVVEEEAAREIQAARLAEMSEDDFALSDDEAAVDAEPTVQKKTQKHPELVPLLSHFSGVVAELEDRTMVAVNALLQDESAAEVSWLVLPSRRIHDRLEQILLDVSVETWCHRKVGGSCILRANRFP